MSHINLHFRLLKIYPSQTIPEKILRKQQKQQKQQKLNIHRRQAAYADIVSRVGTVSRKHIVSRADFVFRPGTVSREHIVSRAGTASREHITSHADFVSRAGITSCAGIASIFTVYIGQAGTPT